MQAKNYTPAASLSTTVPIQPRVLAYWIAASVVVYFLANELLPWTFLSLVGYISIFPRASNKLVTGFIQSENKSVVENRRRLTLFLLDSLNTASLITFMNFPLVSSMLIAALMISRAIYLQGAKGFFLLVPAADLGLAIQQFIDIQTKITKGQDMVFISLLVFTLFSAFLAFVMRDKKASSVKSVGNFWFR